jgi:hypothetical protein
MRRSLATLTLVAGLVVAGCSSGTAPTPQIIYVTPAPSIAEPTDAPHPSQAAAATLAPSVEPPTPEAIPATVAFVRAGARPGAYGSEVWVEYKNVGTTAGYVYESVMVYGATSPIMNPVAEAELYDKQGVILGQVLFDDPLPQVVGPGKPLYLFSALGASSVEASEVARVQMTMNPDFRPLQSPPTFRVKLDTVEYVAGPGPIQPVVYIIVFDKAGKPLGGSISLGAPSLSPGQKGRIQDLRYMFGSEVPQNVRDLLGSEALQDFQNLLGSEALQDFQNLLGSEALQVFAGASWIGEYPY